MALAPNLTVTAVLRSGETAAALRQALTGMNGTRIEVKVGTLGDIAANAAAGAPAPGIWLLDVDASNSAEVELLAQIVQRNGQKAPVIATAANTSAQTMRQLMRVGVVDVVPQPITREDLVAALEYASQVQSVAQAADSGSRARIIAFVKGGGGVGATTLAVQSACVLAGMGKSNEPVACLLDLDFQFGTAALYLDLPGKVDYHELVAAPERIDGALLRGMMSKHSTGLEVLAAPAEVLPLDTITPEFITAALNVAGREFKYVLMDMPEAWTNWSYRALQGADLIIVVTQLTVAGVRQARRQLDTLAAQGIEEGRVRMALNRFEPGWGKSVRVREAEKALGHKVDFFIVNDYSTVSEAINQGVALSRIKARTKVEKCIRKMIEDSISAATGGVEARAEPQFG